MLIFQLRLKNDDGGKWNKEQIFIILGAGPTQGEAKASTEEGWHMPLENIALLPQLRDLNNALHG